ncbi:MAG: S-adenosylmethionine:tRNA ribosyltransferase-isomerase, partial [Candidatus Dormibacteraeota bacterium]|nr:S-adenosylmethionine:tRNA ribosyltransferase-isomerase [Candidatus Dormibacteraeota bacterium]
MTAAALTMAPPPLPAELRAQVPPEMRGVRRDHVRLLVVDADARTLTHARFDQLPRFLRPRDLLVLNTSRTIAAALPATRDDGTSIQLRPCVRRAGSWDVLAVESRAPFDNVPL